MDDIGDRFLEVDEYRQRATEWGMTRDFGRMVQIFSTLSKERRSALLQFATRLLVCQSIETYDKELVTPDSDEVAEEIRERLDEARPRDGVGSFLSSLREYDSNVDEAFFADGTEGLIVGNSLDDAEYGRQFAERAEVERHSDLVRGFVDSQEAFLGTGDELETEADRTMRRGVEWEDWIREWRDRFYLDLLGAYPWSDSDPFKLRQRR